MPQRYGQPSSLDLEQPFLLASTSSTIVQQESHRVRLIQSGTTSSIPVYATYMFKFVNMGLWMAILLVLYGMNRFLVGSGLPYDGFKNQSMLELTRDINQIIQLGGILGWFVEIYAPGKLTGMLRKPWFSILLVVISPIYSWVSNLDALRHSLVDMDNWSAEMTLVFIVGIILVSGVLIRLMYLAYQKYKLGGLIIYTLSRLFLLGWLFIEVVLLSYDFTTQVKMHLHHYIMLWWVATWAEFEGDIMSEIVLAFSTGVFLQGVGAYNAAPIFYPEDHNRQTLSDGISK